MSKQASTIPSSPGDSEVETSYFTSVNKRKRSSCKQANKDQPQVGSQKANTQPIASSSHQPPPSQQESESDTTAPPAKKLRKANPTRGTRRTAEQIPRSYDELSAADKQLLSMREENVPWPECKRAYEKLTGDKLPRSSLQNRHRRILDNLTTIREEDVARLFRAKRQLDEEYQNEKWAKVSKLVREAGGQEYPAATLRRQYKVIMVKGGMEVPEEVGAMDFASSEDEDED